MKRIERRIEKDITSCNKNQENDFVRLEMDTIYNNPNIPNGGKYVVHGKFKGLGHISMQIPADFPFRPPKLFINNIPSKQRLRLTGNRFIQRYQKMFDRCCCCCEDSILSSKKWSPAYTFFDILKELKTQHRDKCLVWYSIFLHQVIEKHQNLPRELESEILSFL